MITLLGQEGKGRLIILERKKIKWISHCIRNDEGNMSFRGEKRREIQYTFMWVSLIRTA